MRSKLLNHATSNCDSLMLPCIGVMRTLGLNADAVFAATYKSNSIMGPISTKILAKDILEPCSA
jgi:hypothetical protein